MRFSSLHPFLKIGTWLLAVAVLALAIQCVAWALGADFNILASKNGARGILLFLTVASLAAIISIDRRPITQYGLFVGPAWKKFFFGGLAIGGGVFVSYMSAAVLLGAFAWRAEPFSAGRLLTAVSRAPTGIPLALTQQFVFSGYLITMLRDRTNRLAAVGISAFLFAVLGRLGDLESLATWEAQSLVIGLFLVAALLGGIRVKTGNILLPAGILAGWLALSRFTAKLQLLTPVKQSPWLEWIAPQGDPRRAPLMWCVYALSFAGVWLWLRRRGEDEAPLDAPAIDADFKRVFPLSHSNCLAPLDVWLRVLLSARMRIGAAYIPRLIAVLVISAVNTLLSLPERLLAPLLVRNKKVADPVFILGVHRSGTTHLHNLMSLDPQFCSPRSYQVMNPAGFLTTGWLIMPVMGMFMSKRPMDNVKFNIFTPGEEEFAIAGMSQMSPYWGLTFPRDWPQHDRFIFPDQLSGAEQASWNRRYADLLRKMTLFSRKRPLLKNPYNTGRMSVLRELYSGAKFIHISRHPHDVHRSNVHMAREGHVLNQLQDPDSTNSYSTRFLENYRAMEQAYVRDAAEVDPNHAIEIRFEDLERDPLAQLRLIYDQLGLQWTEQFESRLQRYLGTLADYQKNKHQTLPAGQAAEINQTMRPFMHRWGYAADGSTNELPWQRKVA